VTQERPLLELRNVTKAYEAFPAPTEVLGGVDFCLASGASVAIVGPSGCGKSTLLNLMGTLDHPTSGSVTFEGQDVLQLNDAERARFRNRQIGFVFQLHHLLPQCSVLENVLVPTLVTAVVGTFLLAISMNGYLIRPIGWSRRVLLIPVSIGLLIPFELGGMNLASNVAGAILGALVLMPEWYSIIRSRLKRFAQN